MGLVDVEQVVGLIALAAMLGYRYGVWRVATRAARLIEAAAARADGAIYVDFSVRGRNGVYRARLADFGTPPQPGSTFRGTDYDEFDIWCRVTAVDREAGVVFHRPVDPASAPGTDAR